MTDSAVEVPPVWQSAGLDGLARESYWRRHRSEAGGNYARGCAFAPDGSCLAVNTADAAVHVFNVPEDLLQGSGEEPIRSPEGTQPGPAAPVFSVHEAELIYDFAWYPLLQSDFPETCLLFTACRDTTVHSWDAFDGSLVASYRNYDQYDAITGCHSLGLTADGHRLVCGLDTLVHVFDVAVPGRAYGKRKTYRRRAGCRGIISAIAPFTEDPHRVALGAYGGGASIMDLRTADTAHDWRLSRGVTDLRVAADDLTVLVGLRACPDVLHFDLRQPGQPVQRLQRTLASNQKLQLALADQGRIGVSGGQDGCLYTWDLHTARRRVDQALGTPTNLNEPAEAPPAPSVTRHLSDTAINGVSVHPWAPLVAVATGQRSFALPMEDDAGPDHPSVQTASPDAKTPRLEPLAAESAVHNAQHRINCAAIYSFPQVCSPALSEQS
ncbi:uncharacterized protein MONBRDRAFT_11919 [Monosiga brevicollis MX1]|uniref:Uncharacterized protein n=1 Tax=Monosiga brevicollis TaxID=81824 RepID=A9VAN9_MONBE|nr:uncharacterized protein MONBRDRAFT_11919 [Monosiga brevicollis MX1]EDQ85406.1 predicted protein [Monosiga brevicollis MX1]|eukprot:XP_001749817.1 hypothetical protein [Monosiga brevicollis MX1]